MKRPNQGKRASLSKKISNRSGKPERDSQSGGLLESSSAADLLLENCREVLATLSLAWFSSGLADSFRVWALSPNSLALSPNSLALALNFSRCFFKVSDWASSSDFALSLLTWSWRFSFDQEKFLILSQMLLSHVESWPNRDWKPSYSVCCWFSATMVSAFLLLL